MKQRRLFLAIDQIRLCGDLDPGLLYEDHAVSAYLATSHGPNSLAFVKRLQTNPTLLVEGGRRLV